MGTGFRAYYSTQLSAAFLTHLLYVTYTSSSLNCRIFWSNDRRSRPTFVPCGWARVPRFVVPSSSTARNKLHFALFLTVLNCQFYVHVVLPCSQQFNCVEWLFVVCFFCFLLFQTSHVRQISTSCRYLVHVTSLPLHYVFYTCSARLNLTEPISYCFRSIHPMEVHWDFLFFVAEFWHFLHDDMYNAIIDASLTQLPNDCLFHHLQKLSFCGTSPMALTEIDSGMLYLVNSKNFGAPAELTLRNINNHPKQLIRFSHFNSITTLEISAMQAIELNRTTARKLPPFP